MKFLVLFCVFAFACGAPSTKLGGRILSAQLTEILEAFRITMKEGNPETGFPILDPLQKETIAFRLKPENKWIVNIAAEGIHLSGLSDFEVNALDFSIDPLGLKYDISVPMNILNAELYNLRGTIFDDVTIYGHGKAYFEIGNLRFSGFAALQLINGEISVKDLNLAIGVDSVKSQLTGMMSGGDMDDVINAMIGENAVDFVNSYSDAIAELFDEALIAWINKLFKGMSLNDLIDLINGA